MFETKYGLKRWRALGGNPSLHQITPRKPRFSGFSAFDFKVLKNPTHTPRGVGGGGVCIGVPAKRGQNGLPTAQQAEKKGKDGACLPGVRRAVRSQVPGERGANWERWVSGSARKYNRDHGAETFYYNPAVLRLSVVEHR